MKSTFTQTLAYCTLLFVLAGMVFSNKAQAQEQEAWEGIKAGSTSNFIRLSGFKDGSGTDKDLDDILNGKDFSIDLWFHFGDQSFNDDRVIFSIGKYKEHDKSISLVVENGDELSVVDELSSQKVMSSVDIEGLLTWHHVAVTFTYAASGGDPKYNVNLYLDETNVNTYYGFEFQIPDDTNLSDWYNDIILMNGTTGGSYSDFKYGLAGALQNFRLWDKALSSDEIKFIKDKTFIENNTISDDGLKGHMLINVVFDGRTINPPNGTSYGSYNYTAEKYYSFLAGDALWSEATPANVAPPMPVIPSFQTNCTSITVNWETVQGLTSYVYRYDGNESVGTEYSGTGRSVTIDVLQGENVTYKVLNYWRLDSQFGEGTTGRLSELLTLGENLQTNEPAQVTGFKIENGTDDCDGIMSLRWDEDTKATKYKIDVQNIENFFVSGTETTYEVPVANLGDTRLFNIQALNDDCAGLWLSDRVSVTFENKPVEDTPSNVVAVSENNTQVKISWDYTQSADKPVAANFLIYRKIDDGISSFGEPIATITGINTLEYTDTELASCTSYTYGVEAVNECGSVAGIIEAAEAVSIEKPFENVFNNFEASAGYYNNYIRLDWAFNPAIESDVDHVEFFKRKTGTEEFINVRSNYDAGETSYQDEDVEANVFYEYGIVAVSECNGEYQYSDTIYTAGFRQKTGIITGNVSYSGGNAVEGVKVNLSESAAPSASMQFESSDKAYLFFDNQQDFWPETAFTLELWARSDSWGAASGYLFANRSFEVLLDGGDLVFNKRNTIGDDYDSYSAGFSDNLLGGDSGWHHIAVSYSADSLSLYFDGTSIMTWNDIVGPVFQAYDTLNSYIACAPVQEGLPVEGFFTGNIKEFRFWNTAKSADEIERNFERTIDGEDDNLLCYLPFNEGFGNMAYDKSKRSGTFNKNNAEIINAEWSSIVPAYDQLHACSYTDNYGNYILSGVTFSGTGEVFYVTPGKGVHVFSPTRKPLFLGDDQLVHNDVDFTDVSSFTVSGTVTYVNGVYPVEEVMIYVDGIVASRDGEVVQTDEFGNFSLDVPIGEHFIEVRKNGHVFVNGGRFPKNELEKWNFNDDISGLNFQDATTVRLMGRVVGGDPQTELPLGFGLSKANIGQAVITLQAGNTVYKLNEFAADTTFYRDTIGGNESTTVFREYSADLPNVIEITTNAESGEFVATLPPVPYNLIGVKTADFENVEDFRRSKETFDMNPAQGQTVEYTDTSGTTLYFDYHDSLKITRYNEPEIIVSDKEAAPGAFGDSVYVYVNSATGDEERIPLYTVEADSTIDYSMDVPVLTQKKQLYTWQVQVYEEYTNNDGAEPLIDRVPLAGAEINIANALAAERLVVDTVTYSETSREDSNTTLVLDSTGIRDYLFRVSFPNMAGDHRLAARLSLDRNGYVYSWEQNAILLGQLPADGNNFVTTGPDHVDIVLHDPPGSNSYAYIAEGSSFTRTEETTNISTITESTDWTTHCGYEEEIGSGFGVFVINEFESVFDLDYGIEIEEEITNNNARQTTLSFNQQISTSGDPNYIGSMADVYIGRSTNLIYGLVNQLALYPTIDKPADITASNTVGDFSLFNKSVYATDVEFGTMFTFTQIHLIEYQIPMWEDLRNQLITPITNSSDTLNIYFGEDKVKYVSLLPMSNPDFGQPGTYWVFYSPDATEEEQQEDKVQEYNTNIENWKQRIADNERMKVELFAARDEKENDAASSVPDAYWDKSSFFENISYDAGVTTEKSLEVNYEETDVNQTLVTVGGYFGGKIGFGVKGVGFEVNAKINANDQFGTQYSDTEAQSMTFGYVLSEDESVLFAGQDALSVDVYGPQSSEMLKLLQDSAITNLSGFTFRTRAGQTSCPYEAADSTIFYTEGNGDPYLLNYGTFKIENAELMIDGQRDTASLENIPSGREATFQLQFSNISEAGMDVTYQFSVDNATNPDGLILSVDGEPLTSARQIRIPYGSTITKTLKVSQSSMDVLDYKGIKIKLGSVCDSEDFEEAFINVSFDPSSSPVTLEAGSQLVNQYLLTENDGKITFTISDYDRTFSNFASIRLQRKRASGDWLTIYEFINDTTIFPITNENQEFIVGATCSYDAYFTELLPADGEYVYRALSVSVIGYDEIYSSSEEINVVKDTRKPEPLGNPSPVTGILNNGDEISITFNEDIQTGLITNYNFSITGVLNASTLAEPTVGIELDGTSYAFTQSPIYTNGSFSIETWFKWPESNAGTLFAYGEGNAYISLGFDAAGHAIATIGDTTLTSIEAISTSQAWKYVSMSYNRDESRLSVYVAESDQTLTMFQDVSFTDQPATQGTFYLGNNAAGDDGFYGAAALTHFYSTARTEDDLSSMSLSKSGNEPNLIGYWALDEGEGTIAKDKARSRHLTMNASWYLYPTGKSLAFDGASNYATIPSGYFPFRTYDNFTWEFWFKGANQGAATLLAVGESTRIGFNASGQLMLTTDGTTQQLAGAGLLDDQWHHVALSVKRTGNTNAYIDGEATASFNSSIFSGDVGNAYYHLGARRETDAFGVETYYDFFAGNIDELRVWGAALSSDDVVLDKNHKLRGNEAGLLAYYPFESYQKLDQIFSVYESLNDMVDPALAVGTMTATSDIAAPMQDCRPVTDVSFSVTPSDRKIVLTLLEDDDKIEGVTLNISAEEIYDMQNNSSDDIKWIAYVNRNALNWQNDAIDVTIAQNIGTTFTASIANSSGSMIDFYIENVPSWLSVSASSGTLQPISSKELTFTIPESINIGSYEASIVLTGDNDVKKVLPVKLKVTGQRPDWSVNPGDFEQSMTATGQLLIEGYPQEDEDDLLAAFIGDTCVGLISPQYESDFQAYFVFLTIWGNAEDNGREVTFKMWDAGTGQIYPVIELTLNTEALNIQFVGDDIKGTVENPIQFNARDVVEQSIALGSGWNWISENVTNDDPTILDQFKENTIDYATQLKANGGEYIINAGTSWAGTVTSLSVTEGYLVKTSREATLKLTGKAVNPLGTPIVLGANSWSWIGYTPQFTMPVQEALAGIANPQEGAQIKGQKGYRIMTSIGWIGSLSVLEPGRGYMYYSNSSEDVSFNYPNFSSTLKDASVFDEISWNTDPHWSADYYRFAENMTVTASVFINEEELQNGTYEIAAFSGKDCRGSTTMKYIGGFEHPFMGFLSVNGEKDDLLQFRIYDHATGTELYATEQLVFDSDSIFGTPEKLFALNAFTKINQEKFDIQVYPNPATTRLYIAHNLGVLEQVEVVDMSGRLLLSNKDFSGAFINVDKLKSGAYLLKVRSNQQVSVYKFIKK